MRKQIIKALSTIAPKMMSNIAYNSLINPQVKKLRDHEIAMLDKAKQSTIQFEGFDIKTYQWGDDQAEKILLIHGWEGQAGNFADIIKKLLTQNYQVLAFDAPSHGFSSKGETSMFEFISLVGEMIKKHECKKLISHSFGGVATTYALFNNSDLEIDKYVLLTTPDKFSERIEAVAQHVGVSDKVKNLLINRLEKEMGMDVSTLNVSNFVKEINVKKALIIHDKNDRVLPISQSKNVFENWDNCKFKTVEGTGHFRILRSEFVSNLVVDFLKNKTNHL